jgi:hypothetical protein
MKNKIRIWSSSLCWNCLEEVKKENDNMYFPEPLCFKCTEYFINKIWENRNTDKYKESMEGLNAV